MGNKPKTTRKTIRLDTDVLEDLEVIGKVDERSFNNLVGIILTKYIYRMKIDPKYAGPIKRANQQGK